MRGDKKRGDKKGGEKGGRKMNVKVNDTQNTLTGFTCEDMERWGCCGDSIWDCLACVCCTIERATEVEDADWE